MAMLEGICQEDLTSSQNESIKPIVSFGLITDIQYADHDDRWNYSQTFMRHYRNWRILLSL